jgi:hypothetical protein
MDYLTYTEEERAATVASLTAEMGSPAEYRLTQLTEMIQVIKGQQEQAELPEIQFGWFDIFCHECGDGDCYQGTVEDAAAEFLPKWAVLDLDRSQAICKTCSNKPDTAHYASQYQDERGLLG